LKHLLRFKEGDRRNGLIVEREQHVAFTQIRGGGRRIGSDPCDNVVAIAVCKKRFRFDPTESNK